MDYDRHKRIPTRLVKYTFPDDDPYQEGNEVYYNMVDFLDDAEVHQIWEIVGKALDRNNIVTSDQ